MAIRYMVSKTKAIDEDEERCVEFNLQKVIDEEEGSFEGDKTLKKRNALHRNNPN